jgi:hypothetical protein
VTVMPGPLPTLAEAGDVIPWPVSLGVAGVCIFALVSLLVWVAKKIGSGQWQPAPTVDKAIELATQGYEKTIAQLNLAYANMVAEKDAQIEGERLAKNEYREIAEVADQGRSRAMGMVEKAVEVNRMQDLAYRVLAQKIDVGLDGGAARQEVGP